MDLIYGPRGSGRTLKCFEYARKNNAIIISDYARRLRVKAKSLGFDDLEIVSPHEVFDARNRNALLHKWDEKLEEQFKFEEGCKVIAISFASEETKSVS